MSISTDYEHQPANPKKRFIISLGASVVICTVTGFLIAQGEGGSMLQGIILGGSLFVCILIPVVYIYTLRTKQQEE